MRVISVSLSVPLGQQPGARIYLQPAMPQHVAAFDLGDIAIGIELDLLTNAGSVGDIEHLFGYRIKPERSRAREIFGELRILLLPIPDCRPSRHMLEAAYLGQRLSSRQELAYLRGDSLRVQCLPPTFSLRRADFLLLARLLAHSAITLAVHCPLLRPLLM